MGYVFAGYGVTLVVLAGYSIQVIRRGRALSRELSRPISDPPVREAAKQWR